MKNTKPSPLFHSLKKINNQAKDYIESFIPPRRSNEETRPETIRTYIKKYPYNIFIETGTLFGDTTNDLKDDFKQLYSIELGENLYKQATERFKNFPQIKILLGDSGKVLPELLKNIKEPVIFYLDGHFSGGVTSRTEVNSPIEKEISAILNHTIKNHVILIDDARLFVGEFGYPTVKNLISTVLKSGAKKSFHIENDLISIVPTNNDSLNEKTWKKYRTPLSQRIYHSYSKLTPRVKKLLGFEKMSSPNETR